MAKAKATKAATPAVEEPTPAVEESGERDYTAYVDKEPTALVEHIVPWIIEKTGVTFGTKKEADAFALGVKLTVALRTHHQASPENQERLESLRSQAEADAAAKLERKAAKAAKAEAAEESTPAPAKAKATPKAKAAKAEEAPAAPAAAPAKKGPKKATGSKAPF